MSIPVNPSSIMIYKIVKDYENEGKTVHTLKELEIFSQKVLNFVNLNTNENFWILPSQEIREDLLKICDVTASICELNSQKCLHGGTKFAKIKIGQMPYSWLKGAITVLNESKEQTHNK